MFIIKWNNCKIFNYLLPIRMKKTDTIWRLVEITKDATFEELAMQFSYIVPMMAVSAVICLICMFIILRNLRVVSAGMAAMVLFLMALWLIAGTLENLFIGVDEKLLMVNLAYIACTMMPPTWILFTSTYITKRLQMKINKIIKWLK